ncbi:MAG: ACP S-malonyltransferase [Acidimicrobiia bacterium]|nr:ACP S-malonyltransferase [Acidimicrobiia bacterium]
MSYAVLFPGQGSQVVGMAEDVRTTRPDLFGEPATSILGWDLDRMIADGPQESLTETQHAQPALFASGFALYEAFAAAVTSLPIAAAGHSLGEYTALAAAGALSYADGLRLVWARGTAMAACAATSPSGMAALIGADADVAEAIAAGRRDDGGALYVANLNAPGQIVLAGSTDDITWLVDNARDLGVRRAIALEVAAGFHSPFMAPAVADLEDALRTVDFETPTFAVYANATASPVSDVRSALATQLTAPVRFSESLEAMARAGVSTFVHVGPGDVTAGLARRTVPDAEVHVVSTLSEAASVAGLLSVQ